MATAMINKINFFLKVITTYLEGLLILAAAGPDWVLFVFSKISKFCEINFEILRNLKSESPGRKTKVRATH
jgi:hypothetical protein